MVPKRGRGQQASACLSLSDGMEVSEGGNVAEKIFTLGFNWIVVLLLFLRTL